MENHPRNTKPGTGDYLRYRGITERSKALVLLLREVPYITARDVQRFFYPTHKSIFYCRVMLRVLLKCSALEKRMLGNGVFVYYLTEEGHRLADFLMDQVPKFHAGTQSFYYGKPPRKPSEAIPFFVFPTSALEFQRFTPNNFHSHPFEHTAALLELTYWLRKSYRFMHVLWLDLVRQKQTALNIPFHPDLLLCNTLSMETGRVYVELENSRIDPKGLLEKINHLTTLPADWYLFLCTSPKIFRNLGRLIRKILDGEAKRTQREGRFTHRAGQALARNVLLGLWEPSLKAGEGIHPLREMELCRYDDEAFDTESWANAVKDGILIRDPVSREPIHRRSKTPYPSRLPGNSKRKMRDILKGYREDFKTALDKVLSESEPRKKPNEAKGTVHDQP